MERKMSTTRDEQLIRLSLEIDEEAQEMLKQVKKTETDPNKAVKKAVDILMEREEFQKKIYHFENMMTHFDRINIAEYSYSKFHPALAQYISIHSATAVHSSSDLYNTILQKGREYFDKLEKGEILGQNLDTEGSNLLNNYGNRIENAARNYYDLYPPFVKVGVKIPRHIKQLYAESRWCYVLQNYCAAVALCRAILELTIKDKTGIDKDFPIVSTSRYLDEAYRKKLISKNSHGISKDIILKANKVMHAGKIIEKKHALQVVEKTKDFLQEMYE